MPYRELDQGIYHVYNRGFEKMRIFECDQDYVRFLQRLEYLLQPPINPGANLNPGIIPARSTPGLMLPKSRGFEMVHLHAFCLLPNHFHFILSGDISLLPSFLGALQGSYAKYFNIRHERRGQVFEGRYNAKLLADEEYLTNCMSYVCYNAIKHELVTDIRDWPWTSYHELIDTNNKAERIKNKEGILDILPRVVPLDGVEIGEYVDIDEE